MDAGASIEEFRQEYLNYLTELENSMRLFNEIPVVREKLSRNGLKPLATIATAKSSVSEMSPEDLTRLRSVYAKFPGWRDISRGIDALIKPEFRQQLEARLADRGNGAETTNSETTDDCEAALKEDVTNTDISIAKAFDIAANAVMEGFPTDGLTILPRLIPIAAVVVTQTAVLTLETLKATKDDCEGDAFQSAIQQQVTNSTSTITGAVSTSTNTITGAVTIATNTIVNNDNLNKTAIINNDNSNKDTIVNNDNANKTTIVNNDNANALALTNLVNSALTQIIANANANKDEMKNLLLRTQIEADLSSTDGSTFVALYETPSTVCFSSLNSAGLPQTGIPSSTVQCGLLDLVRSIVSQTIANVGGSSTAHAQRDLADGDAQRAAGQYKSAYTSYRKAYKTASK